MLAAFFLEACFLGIMLFGMKKVGPRLHFFATCAVAIGSLFSAFWILSANSWMHTPAGYAIGADGRFIARDCWAIIFNPSFPYRLAHMTLAAFPGLATLLAGVSAWQLLRADSLYLRHDLSSTIAALDEFPPQDIPPVHGVLCFSRHGRPGPVGAAGSVGVPWRATNNVWEISLAVGAWG